MEKSRLNEKRIKNQKFKQSTNKEQCHCECGVGGRAADILTGQAVYLLGQGVRLASEPPGSQGAGKMHTHYAEGESLP